MSSPEERLLRSSARFELDRLFFLFGTELCEFSVHFVQRPLTHVSSTNTLPSRRWPLHPANSFLFVQKRFHLLQPHLFIFPSIALPEEADPEQYGHGLVLAPTGCMVWGLKHLGLRFILTHSCTRCDTLCGPSSSASTFHRGDSPFPTVRSCLWTIHFLNTYFTEVWLTHSAADF